MLLACDGIWDVVSNEKAYEYVVNHLKVSQYSALPCSALCTAVPSLRVVQRCTKVLRGNCQACGTNLKSDDNSIVLSQRHSRSKIKSHQKPQFCGYFLS